MAEAAASARSLSEDYLLKEMEEKLDVSSKPGDENVAKEAVKAAPEVPVAESPVEASVATAVSESTPAPVESTEASDAPAEKNAEATDNSEKDVTEAPAAASEETTETADQDNADEETSGIKLETAPGDYRFPTTNQSRHCFTRYVEYHRCIAAKGEGAPECNKFAKYYRSLCPGEWIDRWNEQRENGTFPGPL